MSPEVDFSQTEPDDRPAYPAKSRDSQGYRGPSGRRYADLVCDPQSQEALEFPQLLQAVAQNASSSMGKARVAALQPCAHRPTVLRRLRRLSQLRELISQAGEPGLAGLADIRPFLNRLAVEGAFLLPEELEELAQFIYLVNRAAGFLDQAPEEAEELFRLRNRITPLPQLARRVKSVVGPGQSVSSKASPALASIRKELAGQRERLRTQLSGLFSEPGMGSVFSDQVVTQRADRYVLPVKADAKGRMKGIIHDTSGSGATCFVEPLEAIEGNNKLALLRRQEMEEEARVLREVARELAANMQPLTEDLEAVGKLDALLAQARFCERLDACEPQLTTGYTLDLAQARHPLLAWRAVQGKGPAVPITVSMDPATSVLVISGANAGGKTATLKTVGLLCLMSMCGLHVPAMSGSRLPLYPMVLAEIGDEQDLNQELSTFTAHAGRLAWMLEQAGEGSLLLIDELGNGTDPGEGAALGVSLMEEFIRRQSRVLLTTHFHRIKAFAALNNGVENVSVAFDSKSRRPTYQLHYGAPGFSDALEVSRDLGFPARIIDRAQELVSGDERETVALLRQARDDRQAAARELGEAQKARLAGEESKRQAKEFMKRAQKERAGAQAEGKRRVRQVAKQLEERLNLLYENTKEARQQPQAPKQGKVKQDLYAARREALKQVDNALELEGKSASASDLRGQRLKAGMTVRVNNLNQEGVLLEDPAPGAETVPVSVGVKGVRVLTPLEELEPLSAQPQKAQPAKARVSVQASAGDGLDLKLIGLTVDDAIPLVDKALDQALLAGRPTLRVVHGVGTGRLRNGVRQYLKSHPAVTGLSNEEVKRGGMGVTVARLRL